MKKYIICLLLILFILSLAYYSISGRMYACTSLTGGGSGALDALDIAGGGSPNYAALSNADGAMVVLENDATYGNIIFIYTFDSDSTQAESSPDYIRPDDYSSGGVWELASVSVEKILTYTISDSETIPEAYHRGYTLVNDGSSGTQNITLADLEYETGFYIKCTVAQKIEVSPPSGELFYLDGTALDANDEVDIAAAILTEAYFERVEISSTWYWQVSTVYGSITDGGAS